jgi:hypothetical protein
VLNHGREPLSFREARAADGALQAIPDGPDRAILCYDRGTASGAADFTLAFDRPPQAAPATLSVSGLLFDGSGMPIEMVSADLRLADSPAAAPSLRPGYPNPFNPLTTIPYSLPQAGPARLTVYNSLGQRVACLVDGPRPAGMHEVVWDARGMASGVYYCRLDAGSRRQVQKLVLLR